MTALIKDILLNILKEAIEAENPSEEITPEELKRMAEEDTADTTSEETTEIQKENDRLVDAAFGKSEETAPEFIQKRPKLIISQLATAAKTLGINDSSLLSDTLESRAPEIAQILEKLIVNFRKTHLNSLQLPLDAYLSGEELVKNIETSLIRCKLAFYIALNIYQKNFIGSSTGTGELGPKVELRTDRILAKLLNPNEKELLNIYNIFLSFSKQSQNVILQKQDIISNFVKKGLEIQLNQSPIKEAIDLDLDLARQKEIERRKKKAEMADRAALQFIKTPEEIRQEDEKTREYLRKMEPKNKAALKQKEQEKIGQELAKIEPSSGTTNVATPLTYEGDVASLDESINYLFTSYFNIFLREFVLATPNNIASIDKRIYYRFSNPYTVDKYFEGRRNRGHELETGKKLEKQKNEAAKYQLEIFRNRTLSDEDTLNQDLEPGELPAQETSESEASISKKPSDTDKIVFSSTNLLQEFFGSINYAGCVGQLLENWSNESNKFLVKLFDKKNYKFVDINIVRYLYENSIHYLPTRGTKISDLQIDVLSCARFLITFDGEEAKITEETFDKLKQEFLKIIKEYKLNDFIYTSGTENATKEAARKALNLSNIPAFSIPKVSSTSEVGTFKEKIIEKIKSPTTNYSDQMKELMIDQFNNLTDTNKILNAAKKIFDSTTVGQLLRNSSDKLQYSDRNQAESLAACKKVIKAAEYLMKPDPENLKDRTRYFFINNTKMTKEMLLDHLQKINMVDFSSFIETIEKDPTFELLQKNKEVLKAALNDLKLLKQSSITEDVEQPTETSKPSEILQDEILNTFLKSLIPILQYIGIELHKLGNVLINISKEPKVYFPEIQSEKQFRTALRFGILSKEKIQEIIAVFEQEKDVKNAFSPLEKEGFRDTYEYMQEWILEQFPGDIRKTFLNAFRKAEFDNDWKDLRTLLHDNWEVIKSKIGNKKRIENLIKSLIFSVEKWTNNRKAEEFHSSKISPEEAAIDKEAISKSYDASLGDLW